MPFELVVLLVLAGYVAFIGLLAYWATSPTGSKSRVYFGALLAFLFGAALVGLITYGIIVSVLRARGRVPPR